MAGVRQGVERVRPDAGGVDHDARAHLDVPAVDLDARAAHPAALVEQAAAGRAVEDGRPEVRGGPGDGQRETRVVGAAVVVEQAAPEPVGAQPGGAGQHLGHGEPLVQPADAPSSGQVVGPQQALERLGDARVEDAVLGEHREDERQPLHQVRRVAAEALPLQQRAPHQRQVALLDVAQPAVDHLRRLGGGAGGEVVAFHQRHAQAAGDGVQRGVAAGHAASDDEDVHRAGGQPFDLLLAVEGQRRPPDGVPRL